ncbi:MAG: type II CAAX prenyl endopeptidase Rce1 family protein [Minisyncoccia bacterium]
MSINKKIQDYLNNVSDYSYILIMVMFAWMADVLTGLYANIFNIPFKRLQFDVSPILMFILVVIVGPIIETYLFQVVLIYFLKKVNYLNNKKALLVIAASIIFGILHNYSSDYIIFGFLFGVILNYAYLIYKNKTLSSFIIVLSIHIIYNILVLLVFYL